MVVDAFVSIQVYLIESMSVNESYIAMVLIISDNMMKKYTGTFSIAEIRAD